MDPTDQTPGTGDLCTQQPHGGEASSLSLLPREPPPRAMGREWAEGALTPAKTRRLPREDGGRPGQGAEGWGMQAEGASAPHKTGAPQGEEQDEWAAGAVRFHPGLQRDPQPLLCPSETGGVSSIPGCVEPQGCRDLGPTDSWSRAPAWWGQACLGSRTCCSWGSRGVGDWGGRGDCGGHAWRPPGAVALLVGYSKPSWDLGSDRLPHGTES